MRSVLIRASFFFGCALFSLPVEANASTPMSIKEATKFCEKAIPEHCVAVTCPEFCKRDGKKIPDCATKCTLQEFCKLKAPGKTSGNTARLDADSNDKLMACIAEKRDPEGKTSGRRMDPWQTLGTYKAVNIKSKL